jgi:hypothetical protein
MRLSPVELIMGGTLWGSGSASKKMITSLRTIRIRLDVVAADGAGLYIACTLYICRT